MAGNWWPENDLELLIGDPDLMGESADISDTGTYLCFFLLS